MEIPREFLDELYAKPGNRVPLRYLIDQINNQGVVLAVGRDVAVAVGHPPWRDFLQQFAKKAGIELERDHPARMADRILEAVGETLFYDAIEEAYGFIPSPPAAW